MANQVIPLEGIDKTGFIADTPATNLPPGAWSDVQNVRFDDGAVRKMKGHLAIFLDASELTDIRHIVYWENPNQTQYVVINREEVDDVEIDRSYTIVLNVNGTTTLIPRGDFSVSEGWQSTQFNGGFSIVINNGIDAPQHITATTGVDLLDDVDFAKLPGWDSYLVVDSETTYTQDFVGDGTEVAFTITPIEGSNVTDISIVLDEFHTDTFSGDATEVAFTLTATETDLDPEVIEIQVDGVVVPDTDFTVVEQVVTFDVAPAVGTDNIVIDYAFRDVPQVLTTDYTVDELVITFITAPADGADGVITYVAETEATSVQAEVVIANGNVLVAGGLIEFSGDVAVRSLNGLVRVSDVAAPGTIPQNWNPFAIGVGTADELQIADAGTITAVNSLRGSVFVYTSDTITQLRISAQGLSATIITTEFGAASQHAVYEFRGQHLIVGSDDIYLFSGNPGDIKSVADGRVRKYFFDNINANFYTSMQIIRDQAFDELWICYPTLNSVDGSFDEALIWNYTDNVWTKRQLPRLRSVTIGPIPGGGSARTSLIFSGTNSSNLDNGEVEIQDLTFVDVDIETTPGVLDVQTVTLNGTNSNMFTAEAEAFFLRFPNNFLPSAGSSQWSFDPEVADPEVVFDAAIPNTDFTVNATDTASSLLEIQTTVSTFDFQPLNEEVIIASLDAADVTDIDDVVGNMTFQLDVGGGPLGLANVTPYLATGNEETIVTDIDLSGTNEGMIWVKPDSSSGSEVDTHVYDTIRGPNNRLLTSENGPNFVDADSLDAFESNGWLNDDGTSLSSLNSVNTDYVSWTMKSDEEFFDVVQYTGGAGAYDEGVFSYQLDTPLETGRILTVVANPDGSTDNELGVGNLTVFITGGGGGATIPAGAAQGAGGGGSGTAWATFDVQLGDIVTVTIGDGGTRGANPGEAATPGGDSVVALQRNGVTETIITAGGGAIGGTNGGGGAGGVFTIGTPTFTTITASGGGDGGKGGNGTFQSGTGIAGGGGGAGGYAGNGGEGAMGSGNGVPGVLAGAPDAGSGGAAGGSSSSSGGAGGGGGVGIYGLGADGVPIDGVFQGQGGSGGRQGSSAESEGSPGGGGGGSTNGAGGHGAFRVLSDAAASYPSERVANELVHIEAHNLGVAPAAMLIKNNQAAASWIFFHKDNNLGAGTDSGDPYYFFLNETSAAISDEGTFFNNTFPTATSFTIGNDEGAGSGAVNDDGITYMNYIFASDNLDSVDEDGTGFISDAPDTNGNIYCGAYVANSDDTQALTLGWRPQMLIIRRTDGNAGAVMVFEGREELHYTRLDQISGGNNIFLSNGISFTDTGFEITTAFGNRPEFKGNGDTYSVIAIRSITDPEPLPLLSNSVSYVGTFPTPQDIETGVDISDEGMFITQVDDSRANLWSTNMVSPGDTRWRPDGTESKPQLDPGAITNFGDGIVGLGPRPNVNDNNLDYEMIVWKGASGFFSHARIEAPSGTPPTHISVTHGLGADPVMVWARTEQLQDASENPARDWPVFHRDLGTGGTEARNKFVFLNSPGDDVPAVDDYWGTEELFSDISTRFHLKGNVGNLNQGTSSFINLFCFAADGESAATGTLEVLNAPNADFITDHTVNLGFRPSFVMTKAVGLSDGIGSSNNNENIGIGVGWEYWTTDRQASSVSARDVKTHQLNTPAQPVGSGAQFTDTGFNIRTVVGDAGKGHRFIYYAINSEAVDSNVLGDFNLYNLDGSQVDIGEAGRTAIAQGVGNEAAVVTAINAAVTDPVNNYTATQDGDDINIVQTRWAGLNSSHEIIDSDATFNSVVDNSSEAREQVAPSYRSGQVGYKELLMNLGTGEPISSVVTISQGDGGVGTQLFADPVDTLVEAIGTESTYTFVSPGPDMESFLVMHANGEGDADNDVDTVGALIAAEITADGPDYNATYDATTDTIEMTAVATGVKDDSWTFVASHAVDNLQPIGFDAVVRETPGVDTVADDVDISLVDPFGVTQGTITISVSDPNMSTVVLAETIATAIQGISLEDKVPNFTSSVEGAVVTFTATEDLIVDGLFNTTSDNSDAVIDAIETQPGITPNTPDTLEVLVTDPTGLGAIEPFVSNIFGDDDEGPELDSEVTVLEVRAALNTYFNSFDEFSSVDGDFIDQAGDSVDGLVVTHRQFGEDRYVISVIITQGSDELNDDLLVEREVDDIDIERPWEIGVLNEARNFIVAAAVEDVFAMDIGDDFNGVSLMSFVERRNFQLEPLQDTETLFGFYMNADSTDGEQTFKVMLSAADTASADPDFTNSDQEYEFSVSSDYKVDTRLNGRLVSFRIENDSVTDWEIQNLGVAIGKGGSR